MKNANIRIPLFIVFYLIAMLPSVSSQGDVANIYVSPEGNDANPGTIELPLLTLNGAKNHVRQIKASTQGNIFVWFREGNYLLDETVIFGLEDTGDDKQAITYSAYPSETPVFSSGQVIEG